MDGTGLWPRIRRFCFWDLSRSLRLDADIGEDTLDRHDILLDI